MSQSYEPQSHERAIRKPHGAESFLFVNHELVILSGIVTYSWNQVQAVLYSNGAKGEAGRDIIPVGGKIIIPENGSITISAAGFDVIYSSGENIHFDSWLSLNTQLKVETMALSCQEDPPMETEDCKLLTGDNAHLGDSDGE